MRTELILGFEFNENTPIDVIDSIKYLIGKRKTKPKKYPWLWDCNYLLISSSYYFGVNLHVCKLWLDRISKTWHISTRSNIDNYNNEIEKFLKWIKPYVKKGSGKKDIYAITINCDDGKYIIYSSKK